MFNPIEFFKSHNITIKGKYINNKTKIDICCSKNHVTSITVNNAQMRLHRGSNLCKQCERTKTQNKLKLKVEKLLKKKDYVLLDNEVSYKHKFNYRCTKNHINSMYIVSLMNNKGCPICYGNNPKTFDEVKNKLELVGVKVLGGKYKNVKSKLKCECVNKHCFYTSYDNVINHCRGCPYCAGNVKHTSNIIREEVKKEGYTLISEYINAKSKMTLLCPNEHVYKVSWNNWASKGHRCPKCSDWGTSNFEKEVKGFILSLNINFIENDRATIIGNKGKYLELDILFTCKTKAIECNGLHWHNKPDVKERDEIKQNQCKKLGIKLLTINDKEWKNNKEGCQEKIKNFIL